MAMRAHHGRCGLIAIGFAVALSATEATALLIVTEPWVRPSANARSAEAFMELTSTEGATLVEARCEAPASIEMRAPGTARASVRTIELPAGKKVMLAPGASRLALAGLAPPLRLGDRVALVLIVQAADGSRREVPVNAEVRRNSPTWDHQHGHKH
jgi:copper(I)-binding protein